ncbi:MAG: hypothetical protein IPG12_10785 [Saprospiraceae bacterium]|nr:hypothetical protein [Saprospiraceae bacterium]
MKKHLYFVAVIISFSIPRLAAIDITNGTLGSTSSPTTYNGETINVTGYLRLIGKITFNGCTFNMNTNSEILMTEPAGVNNVATFSGCTLDRTGSSGTWKGINVAYYSFLYFQSNSTLQNAEVGINCAYGSFPSITQCTIAYCQNGINFPNLDTRFNTHPNANIFMRAFYGNLINNCTLNGFKISNIKQIINIGKASQAENNFSNCGTGLNILNSNVTVTLSNFSSNFTGVFVTSSSGNKVSYKCEINGSGSSNNTFNQNNASDIYATGDYQRLIVKNCRFYLPNENGIYIEKLNNGFFNIDNNEFTYTNKTQGIPIAVIKSKDLTDDPTIRYYPTTIKNNKFKFNSANVYLILLSQVSSISSTSIQVKYNTVRAVNNTDACANLTCCFHLEACDRIWVGYNNLKMTGNGLYGLHHTSGMNVDFQTNDVISSAPTTRIGIVLDNANSDFVCNNTIENAQGAIEIQSECRPLEISSNIMKMEASASGYSTGNPKGLNFFGKIPTQTHRANQWVGANFLWEVFYGSTLKNDDELLNRIISRVDNYGTSLKYWPSATKVNRTGFIINRDGSLNGCGQTNETGDPNKYLSDTSNRTSLTTGKLWDNDFYFFDYYSNNLDSLVENDQIDLYDSLSNSNFVDFYNLENSILHFYELDTTVFNVLAALQASYDTFSFQLDTLVYSVMQGDTVLMYDNTEINHLIDTSSEIEDSIDFIIHRIDSSRSVKLDSLFSDYNNLSYNNSYDSLYKELYYVLLKRLNNDTLTTTEYDFLYDLSRECPDEYGVITNKANAILNLEDHLEDLLDNCPSPIVLKSSNLENGHTPILYPNPVSNELTIITEHSIDKCYISDIYGKIL